MVESKHPKTSTVVVDRPPEDVFACLTEMAHFGHWSKAPARWTPLTDGPVGVGSRYRSRVPFGVQTLALETEVVAFEPPSRFEITTRVKKRIVTATYALSADGQGTRVDRTDALTRVPSAVRLLTSALAGVSRKVAQEDLERFKESCENPSTDDEKSARLAGGFLRRLKQPLFVIQIFLAAFLIWTLVSPAVHSSAADYVGAQAVVLFLTALGTFNVVRGIRLRSNFVTGAGALSLVLAGWLAFGVGLIHAPRCVDPRLRVIDASVQKDFDRLAQLDEAPPSSTGLVTYHDTLRHIEASLRKAASAAAEGSPEASRLYSSMAGHTGAMADLLTQAETAALDAKYEAEAAALNADAAQLDQLFNC